MQKTIEKIIYYNCGYCINDLKFVFKKHISEQKKFPAGVFLIKHKNFGYILFDTGYSKDIYNAGIKSKIYNLFNPTFVDIKNQINYQLYDDKIDCEEIKYLIISHLHPDHIGCIKYFNKSKIIISSEVYNTYKKNKIKDLVFKKLLPNWFEENLYIIDEKKLKENKNKYFSYYDLFDDNSILLTVFNGHAKGQLCALIDNRYFLAADSSWSKNLIGKSKKFSFFSKIIQDNMNDYIHNEKLLKKMIDDGIELCFSHDIYNKKNIL